jgi:hypothetical protein
LFIIGPTFGSLKEFGGVSLLTKYVVYWFIVDVGSEESRSIQSFQRDKGREAISATTQWSFVHLDGEAMVGMGTIFLNDLYIGSISNHVLNLLYITNQMRSGFVVGLQLDVTTPLLEECEDDTHILEMGGFGVHRDSRNFRV